MDLNLFKKRLNELYSCWKKHKENLWGNSDLLVIHTPPSYPPAMSSFFYFWLMGNDLPDTTAIFTQKRIYFICPKNRVSVLETLAGPAMETLHAHISVIGKEKGDDGLALMFDVIRRMSPLVVGYIPGDPQMEVLKHMEYQLVPVNNGLSRLSKLFNHGNTKVKNMGNSGGKKMINSRVDHGFYGNGRESTQMQCVSDKSGPVLSTLAKESKQKGNADKLSPRIEEKRLLNIEKEKGNIASMSISCHETRVSSRVEELDANSDEFILLNDEEDEDEDEDEEWELIV